MTGESSAEATDGEKDGGERTGPDQVTGRRLDDIFGVLTDVRRRLVLQYFRTCSDDVATVTDLANFVAKHNEDDDFRRASVALHHKDLPKLVDADLVEYDPQIETVRFVGPQFVYSVLDRADGPTNEASAADPADAVESGAVEHLYDALAAADPVEKDYLVRQALQHIHFERD